MVLIGDCAQQLLVVTVLNCIYLTAFHHQNIFKWLSVNNFIFLMYCITGENCLLERYFLKISFPPPILDKYCFTKYQCLDISIKFQNNLMLSYASAVSYMCKILVKFSAFAELQSFKTQIWLWVFLIVHQQTMNFD